MDLIKDLFKGDKVIWIIFLFQFSVDSENPVFLLFPVSLFDFHCRGIQRCQYAYL